MLPMSTTRLGLRLCSNHAHLLTKPPTSSLRLSSHAARSITTSCAITRIGQLSQQRALFKLITRHASTVTGSVSTSQTQQPSTSALNWNTFFRLRTSRRRYSLASSIISSLGATAGGIIFLSTRPDMADEVIKLIPLDPVISMGILTFVATFAGWLIGPVFGNTVWKIFHRARLTEFTIKERTFFDRIKRHRVNPQGASTNNPVPDYYGEKIGSVSGYRRWLKDQRAFNRKKEGTYPGGI